MTVAHSRPCIPGEGTKLSLPADLTVCVCLLLFQLCATPQMWPAKLLCPWDVSGKKTGVGCHVPLEGIFPTQGSTLSLLHSQMHSLPELLEKLC